RPARTRREGPCEHPPSRAQCRTAHRMVRLAPQRYELPAKDFRCGEARPTNKRHQPEVENERIGHRAPSLAGSSKISVFRHSRVGYGWLLLIFGPDRS